MPRRADTACAMLLSPFSNPIASCAPFAASTSAARDCASGHPAIFFVAGHDDDDVHAIERAHRLQRFERLDDDDVAALHVDDAGALRRVRVNALELLKRAVGFEDRVEMSDEQRARSGARMIRHQMSRAAKRRAVHPRRREPQRVKLRAKQRANRFDAGVVLRAAVDVDRLLEQRDPLGVVVVEELDDGALVARLRGDHSRERQSQQRDQCRGIFI